MFLENTSSKQRPHCRFLSSFFFLPSSSCRSDWMSTFGASWKICCGVFQADRWDERVPPPPPVRRTQVYSVVTHSWASLNGKHNFGFLRREKKSRGELGSPVQKYLVKIWHSSPLPTSVCFPYMTKIFLLKFNSHFVIIGMCLYAHAQMTTN